MPKKTSSGRSRPRVPPPPPETSPQSDSEPYPEVFDPNRTPPPPADAIFRENTPEQKVFEIPPLRSVPRSKPLTGMPPAPRWSRGVKQPKGSAPERSATSGRQTDNPSATNENPLDIIQSSLLQIQSYMNTLAAVRAQQAQPPPLVQSHQTHPSPRAFPTPISSPATLADLIADTQHCRKR